jgi:hypothetical protein
VQCEISIIHCYGFPQVVRESTVCWNEEGLSMVFALQQERNRRSGSAIYLVWFWLDPR